MTLVRYNIYNLPDMRARKPLNSNLLVTLEYCVTKLIIIQRTIMENDY